MSSSALVVQPHSGTAVRLDTLNAALHRLLYAFRSFNAVENHTQIAVVMKLTRWFGRNHLARNPAVCWQQ
jgi:hypothetical protein